MADEVWRRLETRLLQLAALPHNVAELRQRDPAATPERAVQEKMAQIRAGLVGAPIEETFVGPRLFLRAVGARNRAYSGEWWFDAELLDTLERAYSRLYFCSADRRRAIGEMLRELLAVSREWNDLHEVWALELPAGERLVGYSGIGSAQPLFATQPAAARGNRRLVGRAKQIFFPVKNPLWVRIHRTLNT